MRNINLSLKEFGDLSYALIKQEEVIASQQFDGHMYSDTENKITMGIGFNIEVNSVLNIICAKRMDLLKLSSETESYILNDILHDKADVDVVVKLADSISSVIKEFHQQNKIFAKDKQDLSKTTSYTRQEDIDYIDRSTKNIPASYTRKYDEKQETKQNMQNNNNSSHYRALQLEISVNEKISEKIKEINGSKQYAKQYKNFDLILTSEEAKEIFIFLSRSFHKELINSLLSSKNGLKVFTKSESIKYSKLIISFLCGHYQMPAKFNKYNDPTHYFHNAINLYNSRFLTWFGIRYYVDIVSASKNNQYSNYIKRRIHEAAVFELVERKEDGTLDIYQTSKDIFAHLNIIFKFIKADTNPPLKGYDNKTFLEFIMTHHHSKAIDEVAKNKKNNLYFSELKEYSTIFSHVTKIQDVIPCLQDKSSIAETNYIQSILDFATYVDILQPFLVYMNEKFSKGIVDIDYKLNEIYVVSNSNLEEFQNPVKSYFNKDSTNTKNILLISQSNWGIHQRFDNLLDTDKQQNITLYLLKNKQHVLAMDNITQNNFRILLYDDNENINAVSLSGTYTLTNDNNDDKLLYNHESNQEIRAEYISNQNIMEIIYKGTNITLRNFFPSKFHAGIILSNQSEIKEDPTAVSQSGEINITYKFKYNETISKNEIDKKKYYLYNTKTHELIDGIVELDGDNASVCFKINVPADDISNTKLIFSFNKEDFSNLKEANTKSLDTAILNTSDIKSKEVSIGANINQGDISGVITGIELVKPTKENLPDIDSFMDTEYTFKVLSKNVNNLDSIKWCYAVLTAEEYNKNQKVSTVSEEIKQTGEEITFKPKDVLSESNKNKLKNKEKKAKLYIFAYMRSPAYRTKNGQTYVECEVKKDLSNIQIRDTDWHEPLDKMEIALFNTGQYRPSHGTFGNVRAIGEKTHTGLDLFALDDTPVYACMDGIIHYNHSNPEGFGYRIFLEINTEKGLEIYRKHILDKNYQLLYPNLKEIVKGDGYKENSKVYTFAYCHLKEFDTGLIGTKRTVKAGDIIGYTGSSGNARGTDSPHLHIEVRSIGAIGLGGLGQKLNPSCLFSFKYPLSGIAPCNTWIDHKSIDYFFSNKNSYREYIRDNFSEQYNYVAIKYNKNNF